MFKSIFEQNSISVRPHRTGSGEEHSSDRSTGCDVSREKVEAK